MNKLLVWLLCGPGCYFSLPGGYFGLPGGYHILYSLPGGYFSSREAILASREANIYYIASREANIYYIASREAILASREAIIYCIASREARIASREPRGVANHGEARSADAASWRGTGSGRRRRSGGGRRRWAPAPFRTHTTSNAHTARARSVSDK